MHISTKEGQRVYDVYSSLIHTIPEKGIARYTISNESVLGLARNDIKPDQDPQDFLWSLRSEGTLLDGEENIRLDDSRNIIMFNTIAPSPHTVFRVPYQDFDTTWRQKSKEKDIYVPEDRAVLIRGKESQGNHIVPPSYVPLHSLVWLMMEEQYEEHGQLKKRLLPLDLGDLCSPPSDNPMIDKFKLGLQHNEDVLYEVMRAYFKRISLNEATVLDLYNKVIRPGYASDPDFPLELPEMNSQDLLQGVGNGYYRGDKVKHLGQFEYDHLGKGTQSSAPLHGVTVGHAEIVLLKKIAETNNLSLEQVVSVMKSKPQYFGEDFNFESVYLDSENGEQKVEADLLQRLSVTDLIKIIDPYSSIAHELSEHWAEVIISSPTYFQGYDIESFNDHAAKDDEVRSSQGVRISIPYAGQDKEDVAARSMMKGSRFIGEVLYPLWDEVKRYTKNKIIMNNEERNQELSRIKQTYDLPEQMMPTLEALLPTEKQLQNLLEHETNPAKRYKIEKTLRHYDKKKRSMLKQQKELEEKISSGNGYSDDLVDLLYISHTMQIFDSVDGESVNKGYNIPGVPSFSLTYSFDDEQQIFHMSISWTLSMKGHSEHDLGALLKRAEAKV